MNWQSIRWRLLAAMLSLLTALLLTLTYVQVYSQQTIFKSELAHREALLREKTLQRGQMLSGQLAQQAMLEIAVFNFSQLTALIKNAVNDDPELVYGILMDKTRTVHLHTRYPEREYETLSDAAALYAVAQTKPTQQTRYLDNEEIVEFIHPIQVSTEPWGVLRLGFSMKRVTAEIAQSRQEMDTQIQQMVLNSIITAIIFLLIGFVTVFIISTRITKPLIELTFSARELAKGNFSTTISVKKQAQDEINVLASAFAEMAKNIAHFTDELAKLNHAYERFVPREFLNLLDKNSIVDIQLGDHVKREMTILFSDIRSFTTISEKMTPEENFNFINSFLRQMAPIIGEYQGFIDKYIGDGIMALFPTSADNAVQGAIAMLRTLRQYNVGRQRAGYEPIEIGIGLNTGQLMLGTVGGENRMDGTVVADAVNVASRVEGLTKVYGTHLLMTEQTHSCLIESSHYQIRVIDVVPIKGKSEMVTVYEVFDADLPEIIQLKQKTFKNFEMGFSLYHQKEYKKACLFFERVLNENGTDKVARIYLKRCAYSQKYGDEETMLFKQGF